MEWDLSQFGEGTVPNIGSGSGSSGSYGFKEDFSVDLKLGQVVDCSNNENLSVSKTAPSSKRPRASNNTGAHTVSCLVDGCTADLSSCRDYHRRHKVCEIHSKTPNVSINGLNRRFCQQCSRFHSLDEFDEGKRSCRKRLDGHNRRRRKHQPEPLPRSISYLTTNQGTRYIAFSSPQVYPTATMGNSIWGGGITKPKNYLNYEEPSSFRYREEKQLSFFQSTNLELNSQSSRDAFICQPLIKIPPETTANMSEKVLCGEVSNSDCVLSLLSSSPTPASSYMELSHTVHPMFSPAGMSYGGPQHVESLLVPNHRGSEEHRMFEMMPLAPRDDNEHTPFYWD